MLTMVAVIRSGGSGNGPDEDSAVRLIYIVPSDKQELPRMEEGARNALRDVQRWYRSQMPDGATFQVSDKAMIVHHSNHPEEWFRKNPALSRSEDAEFNWLYNAIHEVRWQVWKSSFFRKDRFVILLDADVEGQGHEAAASQQRFAVMPWRYARAYAGQNIEPTCNAVGVLAHELGHIFGLKHPTGCVGADGYANPVPECMQIMYWGSRDYPRTTLSEPDKAQLRGHPMFAERSLPNWPELSCDRLLGLPAAAPVTR
jgi:hypothetical protein